MDRKEPNPYCTRCRIRRVKHKDQTECTKCREFVAEMYRRRRQVNVQGPMVFFGRVIRKPIGGL